MNKERIQEWVDILKSDKPWEIEADVKQLVWEVTERHEAETMLLNTDDIRGNIEVACRRLHGKLKPGEERADLVYIQGFACTALREVDKLRDERDAASALIPLSTDQVIRCIKEAVKKNIRRVPPTWRATELQRLDKAIDEAEVNDEH